MPLIISNFQKGQASSPYLSDGAFAKSQNLDVFSQGGIARINYLPVILSGTVSDLPFNIVRASNSVTTLYASDNSGNTYTIDNSVTPPTITGKGSAGRYVIHWKGYFISPMVSALKYNSAGTTWITFGSAPGTTPEKFIFESKNDGKLYYCDGRYIGSLEENTGQDFNPATAATFTHTPAVFTLPENFQAMGLTETGKYLIIAANSAPVAGNLTVPETTFFFWARGTASTADYITTIPEANMTTLKSVANIIYVTGGIQGNVYSLSESGFSFVVQIPFDLDNNLSIEIGDYGHSSIAFWQNRLLIGVSSDDGLYPAGIYSVKNGKVCHEFLPSEGYDGSTKDIRIGAICPIDNNSFMFGWENNTDGTWGVDKVITSGNRQISYSAYLESIFYPVGTRSAKKSFDKVEIQLARPLQTGEGVRIKWRNDINDDWTTLGTQTYATNGAMSSLEFAGIHNLENIQIRAELTTGATVNTPLLLEIRLLP